MMTADSFHESA